MTEQTARLRLPYILPSQAQKHVTHNEALQRLDAIVQLVIKDVVAAPPDNASEGDCFLLSLDAAGDWAGKGGKLACLPAGRCMAADSAATRLDGMVCQRG